MKEESRKSSKHSLCLFLLSVAMVGLFGLTAAPSSDEAGIKGDTRVADAYARGSDGGFVWTIGTEADSDDVRWPRRRSSGWSAS